MSAKLLELAQRRAMLSARAAGQRAELEQALAPVRKTLAVVDKGIAAALYLRRNPVLFAGAVACVAVFRPRRTFTWLRRGWMVWRTVRTLKRKFMA
jgi:hypothetical protein